LKGKLFANEQLLSDRDGFGIWNETQVQLKSDTNCEVLVMEVPMR